MAHANLDSSDLLKVFSMGTSLRLHLSHNAQVSAQSTCKGLPLVGDEQHVLIGACLPTTSARANQEWEKKSTPSQDSAPQPPCADAHAPTQPSKEGIAGHQRVLDTQTHMCLAAPWHRASLQSQPVTQAQRAHQATVMRGSM